MPFSPINFLMERKRTKPKATEDELAIVKAAAWAWYERGSGSEGKPIREFDFTNNSRKTPTPSRYKIEAMKNTTIDENSSIKRPSTSASISTCPSFNSSLLDNYEIESISKDLDHYIESCNHDSSSRVGDHGGGRHRRVVSVSKIEKGREVVDAKVKSKKLSKGGFLLRHAAVCGSINDVVAARNNIVVGIRGRRQPEKRGPVINSSQLPHTGNPCLVTKSS